MSERAANDTTSPARTATEVYIIDPTTKKPVGPGGGGGGGGDASAANQETQIAAANQANTNLGATNETAAATDTSASGLNGLVKRLLQRVSVLISSLGTIADAAWTGVGDMSLVAGIKAIAGKSLDTAPVNVALQQADYEVVAASASDQPLGTTGAAGDYVAQLVIQPTSTAPGAVALKDGSTTIYSWPGSSSHPAHLPPVIVPLGIKCGGAGFKISTGLNVGVLAAGDFT